MYEENKNVSKNKDLQFVCVVKKKMLDPIRFFNFKY